MDGIIIFNKESGMTSRDVCNIISRKLNIKKVGHTGTLDPLAKGVMIICVNEGCKLVELLTGCDKEYIAKVKVGIKTDTYDVTGKVIDKKDDYILDKDLLIKTLNSFKPSYLQKVPIYSSIKVDGKKLYEYARSNIKIDLPSHMVNINDIKLLDFNNDSFTFKVSVSSGTYIRSLINDIGEKLGIPMTMEELLRTRVGNFKLDEACNIDNLKLINIIDALDIKKVIVNDSNFYKKIRNGVKIKNTYNKDYVLFIMDNKPISIYKSINDYEMTSYRVFNN